jgi:exopolysaccharide production protein ExoQ
MKLPESVESASPATVIDPKSGLVVILFATLFVLATPDIPAMVAFRNKDWEWVNEIPSIVLPITGSCLLARSCIQDRAQFLVRVRRAWPLVLLILLAAMSLRWSIERSVTAGAFRMLLTLSMIGFGITLSRSTREVVDAIALFGVVSICIGSILSFRFPSFRMSDGWLGLFGNRNAFGAETAMVLPFVLCMAVRSRRRLILGFGCVPILLAALVFSRSKTSIFAVLAVVGVALAILVQQYLIRRPQRRGSRPRVAFSVMVAIVVIVVAVGTVVVLSMGVDTTFTGRTAIWREIATAANREWFHGYGFGAFWSGSGGHLAVARVASGKGLPLVTAHNGFLQEYLATGFAGLALLGALFTTIFARGITALRRGSVWQASALLMGATALLIENLFEALSLHPSGLHTVLLTILVTLPPPKTETPVNRRTTTDESPITSVCS